VPAKVVKEKVAKEKSNNITHGMSSSLSGDTNAVPKIVAAKGAFSKLSTHRTTICGHSHIPYKITCQDKFTKMMNDIFDQMDLANDDNFFLNEYPHHVDDVPCIYYLDFDWKLSDAAIDAITDALAKCTKDRTYPTFCIARNEENNKVHLYVKMICEEDAKIGVLSKWHDSMWSNLENLDKQEIDFSKEEWYSKIFDIKAPGLRSIYSVKKSGKGKKIKVESSARYLLLNENYEIYDPLESVTGLTYKRRLIRLLWKCLIYNTEGCKSLILSGMLTL